VPVPRGRSGGFYTGAADRTLARDRVGFSPARYSPMGAAARGPRVKSATPVTSPVSSGSGLLRFRASRPAPGDAGTGAAGGSGAVHAERVTNDGKVQPCRPYRYDSVRCHRKHSEDDPLLGQPITPSKRARQPEPAKRKGHLPAGCPRKSRSFPHQTPYGDSGDSSRPVEASRLRCAFGHARHLMIRSYRRARAWLIEASVGPHVEGGRCR
jgi:hypothetical protein